MKSDAKHIMTGQNAKDYLKQLKTEINERKH